MFWLKQNIICSDRILTLRNKKADSSLPEAIVAGAMEDVAED